MELLAKSKDSKSGFAGRTLKEHIDDCLVIFNFLKLAFPKAAIVSGLDERFWEALRLSIILHDTGKAHQEFQKLLNEKLHNWNHQRHEFFSIPFVDVVLNGNELLPLVEYVIAGHHKDYGELLKKLSIYEAGGSFGMLDTVDEIESYEDAFKKVDVKAVSKMLESYSISVKDIKAKSIKQVIHSYYCSPVKSNSLNYFRLMLLFGGLKWCDHLGSATVTELKMLTDDNFNFLRDQQKVLKAKGTDFYQHQKDCSNTKGNLLLTAPTGSGKTESAFLWLQKQMVNQGQGRVFYILPFTASINAMYERLNNAIGKEQEKVGMLHGKLSDYLNNYFDDLQYAIEEKKDSIYSIKEKFKSIVTPVKVVTPFQLLKHLFGLKGYEQGIFEMAGAYLIFDEIHAYNPETFAQIKVLLEFATKNLQAKVMIMTATVPRFMRSELERSIGNFTIVQADTYLYSQFKRHRVELRNGLLEDNLDEIKGQLLAGRKVLVVCNTVKSAQKIFAELKDEVQNGRGLLLHGSFSGMDRANKEKALMQGEVQLLVGTQAIEVSLDIDYDMIYTEPAPIDALIQRFGRVNRRREKGICSCVVFTDNHDSDFYIYEKTTIEKTIVALNKIVVNNDGVIDESLLQQSIDEVYADWNEIDKKAFDEQYKYLTDALQLLSPMLKNKYTEDDFYEQFDGIKILPQANKSAYERYLSEFDFINAESQKVQIRKGRFMGWKNEGYLKSDISLFAKKNKMVEQQYWITNKKYTIELGLIPDEEESWSAGEIL